MYEQRVKNLIGHMAERGIDIALLTDDDTVYYLTGYYDYLHMEFGRPTILAVERSGDTLLITPAIDVNQARDHARVDRIFPWNDGLGDEWRAELPGLISRGYTVAVESSAIPNVVSTYLGELVDPSGICDITPALSKMRMIKSVEELELARHAGQVAMAMMQVGRETIGVGVAEYEVALATAEAGTRKAAELLQSHYPDSPMSPNTHFLQIMASGDQITRTHHRASNRVMQSGEPVFLCFCGMTNFHRFKLGFDRTFWIDEIRDLEQQAVYEVAVASQGAALSALRPGVAAEEVHAAYAEVIQSAGYEYPFRCGRGTGFSYLENPQLVTGDKTVIQPGMVFAVDGSVTTPTFRAQVGDSVVVTETGFDAVTSHPKDAAEVVIR